MLNADATQAAYIGRQSPEAVLDMTSGQICTLRRLSVTASKDALSQQVV